MTAMTRLDDWPERLAAVVACHRAAEFGWGTFDCATFFADAVQAVCGEDPFNGHGCWASERDALRVLARTKCRSVKECCDARFPIIPASMAQRGDAGYHAAFEPLSCPLVVVGVEAVSRTEAGWLIVPTRLLTTVYRIGR